MTIVDLKRNAKINTPDNIKGSRGGPWSAFYPEEG